MNWLTGICRVRQVWWVEQLGLADPPPARSAEAQCAGLSSLASHKPSLLSLSLQQPNSTQLKFNELDVCCNV
eukprot:3752702-Amphidinium_carterae.2